MATVAACPSDVGSYAEVTEVEEGDSSNQEPQKVDCYNRRELNITSTFFLLLLIHANKMPESSKRIK